MKKFRPVFLLVLFLTGCASGPVTRPNDREWTQIQNEYQRLETERRNAPPTAVNASRKEQIEVRLAVLRRIEPAYSAFFEKLREYYERTGDPRGGRLFAAEKVRMGNDYAELLSRYDRAIELYQAALVVDPTNVEAQQKLERARANRYVDISRFSSIQIGMKEDEVRRAIGSPREDWIKQIVQKNKVYSVWIYPKEGGGACAVYFDNGAVYFVNWNAAAGRAS